MELLQGAKDIFETIDDETIGKEALKFVAD